MRADLIGLQSIIALNFIQKHRLHVGEPSDVILKADYGRISTRQPIRFHQTFSLENSEKARNEKMWQENGNPLSLALHSLSGEELIRKHCHIRDRQGLSEGCKLQPSLRVTMFASSPRAPALPSRRSTHEVLF